MGIPTDGVYELRDDEDWPVEIATKDAQLIVVVDVARDVSPLIDGVNMATVQLHTKLRNVEAAHILLQIATDLAETPDKHDTDRDDS